MSEDRLAPLIEALKGDTEAYGVTSAVTMHYKELDAVLRKQGRPGGLISQSDLANNLNVPLATLRSAIYKVRDYEETQNQLLPYSQKPVEVKAEIIEADISEESKAESTEDKSLGDWEKGQAYLVAVKRKQYELIYIGRVNRELINEYKLDIGLLELDDADKSEYKEHLFMISDNDKINKSTDVGFKIIYKPQIKNKKNRWINTQIR